MISSLEEIENALVVLPKEDLADFDLWYRSGPSSVAGQPVSTELPMSIEISSDELQRVRDFMATQRELVQSYESDA